MDLNLDTNLARELSHSDKKIRDKAVVRLTTVINKSTHSVLEWQKVWKVLFYCFWMSDKPLVQQELALLLAGLLETLSDQDTQLGFLTGFWDMISREWHGIDRLRLNKFYMLLRKMHVATFTLLANKQWDSSLTQEVMAILSKGILRWIISLIVALEAFMFLIR